MQDSPSPKTPASRRLPTRLTVALLALALLLAGLWFAQQRGLLTSGDAGAQGRVYTPPTVGGGPPAATRFTATDQNGRPYAFASENGKVTALFFGFTHCPDVCPLTLTYLEKARGQLPASLQDKVNIVFLSVDPARDTPARLKEYVGFFGRDIVGLHLDEPTLGEVARAYGIQYSKGDVKDAGSYQVFHNSATFLIDRQNHMRLMYSQVPSVERLAQDMRAALDQ